MTGHQLLGARHRDMGGVGCKFMGKGFAIWLSHVYENGTDEGWKWWKRFFFSSA